MTGHFSHVLSPQSNFFDVGKLFIFSNSHFVHGSYKGVDPGIFKISLALTSVGLWYGVYY